MRLARVALLLLLGLSIGLPVAGARSERVSPEVASGVLLSDLAPALPERSDVTLVQLYPIAINEQGRFAWMRGASFAEVEGWSWQVIVQDLVTDEVVGRLDGLPTASVTSASEAVASRRSELEKLLARNGFDDRTVVFRGSPLQPLPLIRHDDGANAAPDHGQDEILTVEVEAAGEGRFDVRLRSSTRGVKTIGQVEAHLGGPTPVGVLVASLEPQIAVVLQYAAQPLHGADPKILDFAVLGAHLEAGWPTSQGR